VLLILPLNNLLLHVRLTLLLLLLLTSDRNLSILSMVPSGCCASRGKTTLRISRLTSVSSGSAVFSSDADSAKNGCKKRHIRAAGAGLRQEA
jgi:hypothetical protein